MRCTIFCFSDSFLEPIILACKQLFDSVHVHVWDWRSGIDWRKYGVSLTVGEPTLGLVKRLVEKSDLVFFDFARDPLPLVTRLREEGYANPKIVVRLIGHELWLPNILVHTSWRMVDTVIVLNSYAEAKFRKRMLNIFRKELPCKIVKIPPGIDCRRLRPLRDLSEKPFPKTICVVCYIHHRKRIYTTVETYYELLKRDPEWRLYIRGKVLDDMYWEWVEDLTNVLGVTVYYEDFGTLEEWWSYAPQYFWDKSIILSNSMEEMFHVTVAEAAACGTLPMIFNWPAAEELWPRDWIYRTQTELVEKLLEWAKLPREEKVKLAKEARQFVEERYDYTKIVKQLVKTLEQVVT